MLKRLQYNLHDSYTVKTIRFIVLCILILSISCIAFAATQIIKVNGQAIRISQDPILENNILLTPLRTICDAMGVLQESRTEGQLIKYKISYRGKTRWINIGNQFMTDENGQSIDLGIAPRRQNGIDYFPIETIFKSLGANVTWNRLANIMEITTPGYTPSPQTASIPNSGGSVRVSRATEYSFTPNASGSWVFRTSNNGTSDPVLTLLNSSGGQLAAGDDEGGNNNAQITFSLTANTRYIVRATFYGSSSGSYDLNVTRQAQTPQSITPYVTFRNETNFVILEFYLRSTGSLSWVKYTYPGSTSKLSYQRVELSSSFKSDHYDVQVKTRPADGSITYTKYNVHLSSGSSITFTERDRESTIPTIPGSGGTVRVTKTTDYSFTPSTSATWTFKTLNNGSSDPVLTLLNSSGTQLAQDDDGAGRPNSSISYYLSAYSRYTIRAGFYKNGSGSYDLLVTRQVEYSPPTSSTYTYPEFTYRTYREPSSPRSVYGHVFGGYSYMYMIDSDAGKALEHNDGGTYGVSLLWFPGNEAMLEFGLMHTQRGYLDKVVKERARVTYTDFFFKAGFYGEITANAHLSFPLVGIAYSKDFTNKFKDDVTIMIGANCFIENVSLGVGFDFGTNEKVYRDYTTRTGRVTFGFKF